MDRLLDWKIGADLFYPARDSGHTAIQQGGYQVAATFVSFGVAIVSGLVVGFILRSRLFNQPHVLLNDGVCIFSFISTSCLIVCVILNH